MSACGDIDRVQVYLDSESAGVGELGCHAGDAARAEVLEPDLDPLLFGEVEDLSVRYREHTFEEGIGDLNGAPVRLLAFDEVFRGESRPAESRVVGRLAYKYDLVWFFGCLFRHPAPQYARLHDRSESDHVDEAVLVEPGVELAVRVRKRPDLVPDHVDRPSVRDRAVDRRHEQFPHRYSILMCGRRKYMDPRQNNGSQQSLNHREFYLK